MADPTVNGVLEMTDAHVLGPDTLIVDSDGIQGPENDVTEEDILRQALDSETLVTGPYTSGDESVAENLVGNVHTGTFVDASDATSVTDEVSFDGATYSVVNSGDNVVFTTGDSATEADIESASSVQQDNTQGTMNLEVDEDSVNMMTNEETTTLMTEMGTDNENSNLMDTGTEITATTGGISVRLVPVNEGSGAPLGSSQNPIRIIQQGNQYTPVQHLTTEQLQQIMQVVQEQQVAKSTAQEGSSILYNPQTNTRIVYRVIYPSELHKKSTPNNSVTVQTQGQQTVILSQGRRPYKKRKLDEDDKMDGPELSKEEKEIRKKHRPRTRSGRISKPPKHMVKDYKHIHVLDWDEDYDDSDGGYSDFKYSEDEREERDAESYEGGSGMEPGMGVGKPKKWKCEKCHKGYIGRGGLRRHYRLNPDHGSIYDIPDDMETSSGLNRTTHNGLNNTGNLSEDSNTQDSLTGAPTVARPHRGGFRGRLSYLEHSVRRKNKLREIVRQCEDEDLMEIVLPRLAKVITLWEFLLMKVEKGTPLKPHVDDVYREFQVLSKQVQKVCQTFLKPQEDSTAENNAKNNNTLKLDDVRLAAMLGLGVGTYEVNEPSETELTSTFHYNPLPKDTAASPIRPRNRKTVDFVNSQIGQQASKKVSRTAVTGGNITISPAQQTVVHTATGNLTTIPVQSNRLGKIDSVVQTTTQQTHTVTLPIISSFGTTVPSQSQVAGGIPVVIRQAASSPVVIQTLGSTPNIKTATVSKSSVMPGVSLLPADLKSIGGAQKVVSKPVTPASNSVTFFSSIAQPTSSVISNSLTSNKSTNPVQVLVTPDSVPTQVTSAPELVSVPSVTNEILQADTISFTTVSEQTENGVICEKSDTEENEILLPISQQSVPAQEELYMEKSLNSVTCKVSDDSEALDIMDTSGGGEPSDLQQGEVVQLVEDQILREGEQVEGIQVGSDQIITASNIYQTAEGIIIIQNQDGSTVQLQGGDGEPIPLETLQALLTMDGEGQQLLQTAVAGESLDQ